MDSSLIRPKMKIHLIGIGGFGLSAIAELLLGRGHEVSGSDILLNDRTQVLAGKGASVFIGHSGDNVEGADLIVVSSAVPVDNVELLAAARLGTPIMKRAEFLGAITIDNMTIAVAGSHGKTTTTGMITQIMIAAGLDPSFIIGGVLPLTGNNGHAGTGKHFVIEADEYDYMFLGLSPELAIITNVEYDHPDMFPSQAIYRSAFDQFVEKINPGGKLFVCADDQGAMNLPSISEKPSLSVVSYGVHSGSWQAKDMQTNPLGGMDFLVTREDEVVGLARLRVPGVHNVRNGLAAVAISQELGIPFNTIRQSLAEFGGIGRRFQIVGEVADVTVVDDYAHHPTEIQATLKAARQRFPGRRLWAVWQPHTYSRIKELEAGFATCFTEADRLVALDIYRSRETNDLNISTQDVLISIEGPQADYVAGIDDAAAFILERILPGDVVLTLSAGDGNQVGEIIISELEKRLPSGQVANQEEYLPGSRIEPGDIS